MATSNRRGAYDDEEETPIERTRARKSGGSFRLTLRADSSRAIGLNPGDVSSEEEIEFLVSEVESEDGRLVFDLLDSPAELVDSPNLDQS